MIRGVKLTAANVISALAERHPHPEWVFLREVRNGTGWTRVTRSADALAISCWPSRGIHVHGFEVKVSKSDWKREKVDPEKAEEIASRCDYWWVAAPAGLVPLDEVPVNWGLLEVAEDGKKIKQARAATMLARREMTPQFFASIVRRAYDEGRRAEPEEQRRAVAAARSAGFEEGAKRAAKDAVAAESRYATLRAAVDRFERESGVKVHEYGGENVARAVARVLAADRADRDVAALVQRLEHARDEVDRLARALRGDAPI